MGECGCNGEAAVGSLYLTQGATDALGQPLGAADWPPSRVPAIGSRANQSMSTRNSPPFFISKENETDKKGATMGTDGAFFCVVRVMLGNG